MARKASSAATNILWFPVACHEAAFALLDGTPHELL